MKIISEKTGKEYPNVELCLAAEKEYDDKITQAKKAEEEKRQALVAKKEADIAARKEAAAAVEEKRKVLLSAEEEFRKELAKFCEKYGAYHYTIKSGDESWAQLFDNFWNHFWF